MNKNYKLHAALVVVIFFLLILFAAWQSNQPGHQPNLYNPITFQINPPVDKLVFSLQNREDRQADNFWTFFAGGCNSDPLSQNFSCSIRIPEDQKISIIEEFGPIDGKYIPPQAIPVDWGYNQAASVLACTALNAGLHVRAEKILGAMSFQPEGYPDLCPQLYLRFDPVRDKEGDILFANHAGSDIMLNIQGENQEITIWYTLENEN